MQKSDTCLEKVLVLLCIGANDLGTSWGSLTFIPINCGARVLIFSAVSWYFPWHCTLKMNNAHLSNRTALAGPFLFRRERSAQPTPRPEGTQRQRSWFVIAFAHRIAPHVRPPWTWRNHGPWPTIKIIKQQSIAFNWFTWFNTFHHVSIAFQQGLGSGFRFLQHGFQLQVSKTSGLNFIQRK